MFAGAAREAVFSKAENIRRINADFVPVALKAGLVYQPFAQGWLLGDTAWGRPVDLEVLPDGSLAVSDDSAGVIYRISYAPSR